MTLDAHRRDTLLKAVRGNNFRRALKAIAELRAAHEPGLADVVAAHRAPEARVPVPGRPHGTRAGRSGAGRRVARPRRPEVVARRARATRGLVEMLTQHRQAPSVVLAQIVEILGHTATKHDREAVQPLEELAPQSGEPFRVTYEELDERKLDWRERLLAERKGIDPARLRARIGYQPTGRLDRKVLAAARARIQARD